MPRIYKKIPIEQRFWKKVEKGAAPTNCWKWKGATNGKGYGKIGASVEPINIYAHRLSWVLHYGDIPEGMFVLHHCDNPQCTNPKHLFLGEDLDNSDDKLAKNRHRFGHHIGETHPRAILTEDNVKEILSPANADKSNKQLAQQYGVTDGAIYRIRKGKNWRHLFLPP